MRRPVIAQAEWTCPMHSEIGRGAAGACPRCGMALEPRAVSPAAENLPRDPTTTGSKLPSAPFHIAVWLGAALFSTVAVYLLWGEHHALWPLVFINSSVFILFAFSFFKPKIKRDWRNFSGFSGFIIASFAEMYGFPLTIYLLSGWLTRRFPGANLFSHDMRHLWYQRMRFNGDPHTNPIHLASIVFIIAGFLLLAASWNAFFAAQKAKRLATGPYNHVRHPQYVALIVIMLSFFLLWPTLITLVMFPVLVVAYVRLAHREEGKAVAEFGQLWMNYARCTPRWFPSSWLPTLRRDGRVVHFWGQ